MVLSVTDIGTMLAHVQVQSSLVEKVNQLQQEDNFCQRKKTQVEQGLFEGFRIDDDGTLWLVKWSSCSTFDRGYSKLTPRSSS